MQCLSDGLILASADDSVALVSHGMIRKVKILAHVHVFGSCTCVYCRTALTRHDKYLDEFRQGSFLNG